MKTTLQDLLASQEVVVTDGAMGTMLIALGLRNGESPERWNVERPDDVRSVHRGYIEAGSQVILTNTFGCNYQRLQLHGLQDRAAELNTAAARLARAEADIAAQPVAVAGSMGPTSVLLTPYGDLEVEEAVYIFAEQAGALAAGGVDVFWIETMSDLGEAQAAVQGCQKAAPTIPIVTTLTFEKKGRTMMGATPQQLLEGLGSETLALGGNCGNGPQEIETVIEKMHAEDPAKALVAKANAGLPRIVDGSPVYDATLDVMAAYALRVRGLGARIIGACCGSNPTHIRAMAEALHSTHPA